MRFLGLFDFGFRHRQLFEHGGDPVSIRFCHHIGITYVSCSGPRVPVARLAAAQAKLLEREYVDQSG